MEHQRYQIKEERLSIGAVSQNSESGESIVSVMVALGILGIVALGVSVAMGNVHNANKALKISQALNKTQDAIRSVISKRARDFANNGCLDESQGGGFSTYFAANDMRIIKNANDDISLEFEKNITQSGDPVSREMSEAASRCATPVYHDPVKDGEFSRFCLKVSKATGTSGTLSNADQDTFWTKEIFPNNGTPANAPFVEVLIIPINLTSDTPVTCAALPSSGQNGLKVLYSLWWYKKSQDGPEMSSKHRNGVFYVTQH